MEQVLRFGNEKSDEETVYGLIGSSYPFNIDVETLLTNSNETRRAKRNIKKGIIGEPPRPQNSWIIYGRDKRANPEFVGKKQKVISYEISKLWKKESEEVKGLFEALARMSLKRHKEIYGENYQYKPKSKNNKKARPEQDDKNLELISPPTSSDVNGSLESSPFSFGSPSLMDNDFQMDFESLLISNDNYQNHFESPLTTNYHPQELESPFTAVDFVSSSPYETSQCMIDFSPPTLPYFNDMYVTNCANFAPMSSIAPSQTFHMPYGYGPEGNVAPLNPTSTTSPPDTTHISQFSEHEYALLLKDLISDGHIISEEISPSQPDFYLFSNEVPFLIYNNPDFGSLQ
ncbi:1179_t:CDS:2 [Funneliformis geosporum]|uniref:1179_t:CDS:1 n=1 Tax=Funneliformis geosporum TaxID=1117311 RepID=A0A9W4SLC5_9GLOM|nr:1179_t:CDS:2 [Funneliformis geosporum]